MVEQLCPNCRAANPLANVYCGQCGASLGAISDGALVHQPHADLTVGPGRLLPAPSLQQVGRAVAVSLVALAAEVGLSWLRRRLLPSETGTPIVPVRKERKDESRALVGPVPDSETGTTVVSQRIVRIWRRGRLRGESVEQAWWQVDD